MKDNGNGIKANPTIPDPPVAYYDFNKSVARVPTATMPVGPSLTRQEFAEDCDINVLMKRFENRDIGSIMRAAGEPVYADFTQAPSDLMGYMQLMQDADRAFMTLPATVRRQFDNSATEFVDFASDPSNLDQMRAWGLAPPAPVAPAPPDAMPGGQQHSSPLDVTVLTDTKPENGGHE